MTQAPVRWQYRRVLFFKRKRCSLIRRPSSPDSGVHVLPNQDRHTFAFGTGLRNVFAVTHQMLSFHFTPSLVATAPRSSFADIQRRFSRRFFSSILISPWWPKTFLILTLSHSQRRLFLGVKGIRNRRTHWTRIMSCYLAKSVAQKNYHTRVQTVIEELPPPVLVRVLADKRLCEMT